MVCQVRRSVYQDCLLKGRPDEGSLGAPVDVQVEVAGVAGDGAVTERSGLLPAAPRPGVHDHRG